MAEDKEQDLSMEDILSSIKNILSEDEQGKEVPAATPQPEPVAEAAAPAKREFKIIEISPADAKSELISGSEEVKAPKVTRTRRTAKSVAAAAVL